MTSRTFRRVAFARLLSSGSKISPMSTNATGSSPVRLDPTSVGAAVTHVLDLFNIERKGRSQPNHKLTGALLDLWKHGHAKIGSHRLCESAPVPAVLPKSHLG